MLHSTTSGNGILIVEDDEAIREAMHFALICEGYNVFTAMNGQKALDLLAVIPTPKLILVDLMMPVMNGIDFIESLAKKSDLAKIPVLVVSAFAEKERLLQKVQGFLKKPVNLETLLEAVKKYCT